MLIGDAGLERRRLELGVTEQNLDHADVDVLFEQMKVAKLCRKVCGDTGLVGSRRLRRRIDDASELASRHRIDWVLAWKQPGPRPRRPPPVAQQFEQLRREHHIAIPLPFALLDPKRHALAVNVGYLQVRDLGDAQARAVGDAERGFVLQAGRGFRADAPPPPGSARPALGAACSRSSEEERGRAVRASR